MADYLPIYIVISLVPLSFLLVACYSHLSSSKSRANQQEAMRLSATQRLSEWLPSYFTRRKRTAITTTTTTNGPQPPTNLDLEMQCPQVPTIPHPPSNHDLHRIAALARAPHLPSSPRTTLARHPRPRAPNPDAAEAQHHHHHRAAALAALERPRSSIGSRSLALALHDLPPRPSAPSPPSSTASPDRFYPPSWQCRWEELAGSEYGDGYASADGVIPAFQRKMAIPGKKKSVFRSPETESRGVEQCGGWTEVSLR